jgi:hypothetical protein
VSSSGNGEIGALFSSSSKNLLVGATVVSLEDGLFGAKISRSREGPVHSRTKAQRNREDSCEESARLVVLGSQQVTKRTG